MISRRFFFAGLAALPFTRLLEPLARWFRPAELPVGNHFHMLVFDDIETGHDVLTVEMIDRVVAQAKAMRMAPIIGPDGKPYYWFSGTGEGSRLVPVEKP